MSREDELLKRFTLRTRGEEAIQELLSKIIRKRSKRLAKEWLSKPTYTMVVGDYEIICKRTGDFSVNGVEFPYNFIYVNQVCQSLLLDEDGV